MQKANCPKERVNAWNSGEIADDKNYTRRGEVHVNETMINAAMALWLGILTSISPCPLATNIAAISYVGRRVDSSRKVLFSGLLYTIGRAAAYILVAFLIVKGILSIPGVSKFLQHKGKVFNIYLGF
jgi:cytochrome c biogenesis protein CcdA